MLRTIRPDGTMGLTNPEEIDDLLVRGAIVERFDVAPETETPK